jgi:hypothetical protein
MCWASYRVGSCRRWSRNWWNTCANPGISTRAEISHRWFTATRAGLESQISTYLDEHVGKLACVSQTPLLAYLLRVDPLAADTPLEKALAARGKGWSACKLPLAGCGQAAE